MATANKEAAAEADNAAKAAANASKSFSDYGYRLTQTAGFYKLNNEQLDLMNRQFSGIKLGMEATFRAAQMKEYTQQIYSANTAMQRLTNASAQEESEKAKEREKLRQKNKKSGGSDFLKLIGTGILVSIPMLWFTFKNSGASSKPSVYQAQSACESAVTGILKSPSSADFGGWQRRENADGTFEISGYVDSQNSFGAMLRAQFSCSVDASGNQAKITYFR